ncbi:MAG TPA: hypothetical protein ENN17_00810 [bacterium]|nr:hypothetical protein [bacterium]
MAYLFIDDRGAEAEEYESNYFYFDETDTDWYSHILSLLGRRPSDVPSGTFGDSSAARRGYPFRRHHGQDRKVRVKTGVST